jgi:hypothetical protein
MRDLLRKEHMRKYFDGFWTMNQILMLEVLRLILLTRGQYREFS